MCYETDIVKKLAYRPASAGLLCLDTDSMYHSRHDMLELLRNRQTGRAKSMPLLSYRSGIYAGYLLFKWAQSISIPLCRHPRL